VLDAAEVETAKRFASGSPRQRAGHTDRIKNGRFDFLTASTAPENRHALSAMFKTKFARVREGNRTLTGKARPTGRVFFLSRADRDPKEEAPHGGEAGLLSPLGDCVMVRVHHCPFS
jgi:hypothetical protein